jgi:hypothetical protein
MKSAWLMDTANKPVMTVRLIVVKKEGYVHMHQYGICSFTGLTVLSLILAPGIARGAAGPTTAARFFKFFKAVALPRNRQIASEKKVKKRSRT